MLTSNHCLKAMGAAIAMASSQTPLTPGGGEPKSQQTGAMKSVTNHI